MNAQALKNILPCACLGATLLALAPARAALNAYLTLKGEKQGVIQGGVTQKGRENKILLIAYNHEIKVPVDVATGQTAGRRQHGLFTITKEVDRSSPLLYQALATNEAFPQFELQCWRATPTGLEQQHYTIKLTNARVVGIRQQMPNTANPDLKRYETYEEVSFSYQTITWTWTEGGITATDTRQ